MRFAVILLVLSMALVLGGTLAQRHMGIFEAQHSYFLSWLVWLRLPGTPATIPMFPGGYLLGTLLIVNLLAGLWQKRHRFWREPAFLLTHGGLILLVVGVLANEVMSVESYMEINQGESRSYSEDYRQTELVARRQVDAQSDELVCIPESRFSRPVTAAALPGQLRVVAQYPNTVLIVSGIKDGELSYEPRQAPEEIINSAQRCLTIEVALQQGEQTLGRWWLSSSPVWDGHAFNPQAPATVTVAGQSWHLSLRLRRYDYGQTLALKAFTHQRYAGSDISAQFSSMVTATDPAQGLARDAVISMNRPLRFGGVTYYQSGYKNQEQTTVLQVVRNPGWLFPYLSCTLISLGMIWGFWRGLQRYLAHRDTRAAVPSLAPPVPRKVRLAGWGLALVLLVWTLGYLVAPSSPGKLPVADFGRLPVLDNGRLKPLDSVARNTLLQLHGKQQLRTPTGTLSASAWLLQVLTRPDLADAQPLFVLDNPDVLGLMGRVPEDGRYYSYNELAPYQAAFTRQLAQLTEAKTAYDRALGNLYQGLQLYNGLKQSLHPATGFDYAGAVLAEVKAGGEQWSPAIGGTARLLAEASSLRLIPPVAGVPEANWRNTGEAIMTARRPADLDLVAQGYLGLLLAYQQDDAAAFGSAVNGLQGQLAAQPASSEARAEFRYNHTAPFYLALCLYGVVFLLMLLAWLRWWQYARQAAASVLVLALAWHSVGLVWRMWLHGYAPVTNLYSSAIFVGWMAVALSVFLEIRHRHGIGNVAGAVVGFSTLIVAHHLARGGETMEMMRAVLASNFWLSTHVTTIAMGYGGMFLAGAVAICAIFRDAFGRRGGLATRHMAPTVYGIICFATLFSFVGTVLGGIWADQSWGRFWGWDPKENGALMIVCWCAMILHGRVGHLITDRGLMLLAVGGNIITALSWFGVNLLGVGLHAYGFTDSGLFWLMLFSASQLLIIGIGALWPPPPGLPVSQRHAATDWSTKASMNLEA
jgi:ABC-type transport system involved in cytochrome c biogenesis permease subunit